MWLLQDSIVTCLLSSSSSSVRQSKQVVILAQCSYITMEEVEPKKSVIWYLVGTRPLIPHIIVAYSTIIELRLNFKSCQYRDFVGKYIFHVSITELWNVKWRTSISIAIFLVWNICLIYRSCWGKIWEHRLINCQASTQNIFEGTVTPYPEIRYVSTGKRITDGNTYWSNG